MSDATTSPDGTATSPSPAAVPTSPDDAGVVVVTRQDGVATVRLNRPDAMNALNTELKVALLAALQEAADDPQVRCVVLTGTGRAFCVGQDLREHVASLRARQQPGGSEAAESSLGSTVQEHYNPIATLLATMNKPVVAALNGVTAGAGASFALAADYRLMVEGAGLNTAFAGIALSCDSGASWHLPRLLGPAKAKDLLLFPRTVDAMECLQLGLVSKVVPAESFQREVDALAGRLAAGPTLAYGSIRRAVAFSAAHTLQESLAHEGELMGYTGGTADHSAAVDAFLAKDKPVFTGT